MEAERARNVLAIVVLAIAPATARTQILTDGDFHAADYTAFGQGLSDIRFNIDYSNIDIFGDGFIAASIPEAPRSGVVGGAATTGVFLSANNDSTNPNSGQIAASAIYPGLNVGSGTANTDYKITVDIFHSTATGVFDPDLDLIFTRGTVNNTIIGTNMATTSLALTGAAGSFGTADNQQGQVVAVTASGDAADDYKVYYAGQEYRSRTSSGALDIESGEVPTTGLAADRINEFWADQGFDRFGTDTPQPEDDLNDFSGDAFFFSPDLNNPGGYDGTDGVNTGVQFYLPQFPVHGDPLHINVPDLTIAGFGPDARVLGNDELTPADSPTQQTRFSADGGVPYNRWATHEIYYSDTQGTFTYVINGVPVLEQIIDADETTTGTNIITEISRSGDIMLGFWDRFTSISLDPEGANFVVYDNLVVEAVDSNDIPDMEQFLIDNGFIIPEPSSAGLLSVGLLMLQRRLRRHPLSNLA